MEEAMNVSYWIRRRRKLPRKMVREFSEALFCSPSDLSVDLTGRLEVELVGRINELPDEDKLAILRFIDYVCDKRVI